jgi:hypothetical protein
MSNTLQQAEPESARSGDAVAGQRPRWTQTHTVWLLLVLSLLPGLVVALDREGWTALPAGIRGAAYLTSAVLLAVACGLILRRGGDKNEVS